MASEIQNTIASGSPAVTSRIASPAAGLQSKAPVVKAPAQPKVTAHKPTDTKFDSREVGQHFQKAVIPGWLDKSLNWRHKATTYLDNTIVLAPRPEWVKSLPNGKLPDRQDFVTYGQDLNARVKVWQSATGASQQLADEFAQWLEKPDMSFVQDI